MEMPKIDLKNIDKRFIKMGIIGLCVIVIIIVCLILARIFITSKLSYVELEDKMRDEAIEYYSNHKDLLPNTNDGEVTLDIQKLIDDERMKPFEKYLKDDTVSCEGKVVVTVNDSNYLYTPYLDCGKEYKTITLTETLINNDNIVDTGDGLYDMGDYYLYRGEKVNNYIEFAGQVWRILRINNDGTIRIIQNDITLIEKTKKFVFDNRYNSEKKSKVGFNNFDISRIKDTINEVYESDVFSDEDKSYIVPRNLCIGTRYENNNDISDNVECATQTQNKYSLSLIQSNDYMLASLDSKCTGYKSKECSNYNYMANFAGEFWTLTPYASDYNSTYQVYIVSGSLHYNKANLKKNIKLVTNISSHALYESGDGTEENPYIIKYNNYK